MSWITVTWSLVAGISIALAAMHLLVWLRTHDAAANLLMSISAIAAAVIAFQELNLMRAQTPAEAESALRWMHLSAATIIVSVVWFTRLYLMAGRVWLAWLITGVRALVLVANFVYPNATFLSIDELRQVLWLGESLSLPVGESNPWRYLIHVSTLLWVVFTIDAVISARKSGSGQGGFIVGGAIVTAIILAAIFSGLMVRGVLPGPLIAPVYLIVVLAMAFELSSDLIRAKRLAGELHESRERMRLAARAADLGLWEWEVATDKLWANDVGEVRAGFTAGKTAKLEDYLMQVHPGDRASVEAAIRQAVGEGAELHAEYRMTGADGRERWIDAWGRAEYDGKRNPLRFRGVSADVTKRKRLEIEAQRYRDELARAQRVLVLGQLSSVVAHELNQPLGAILRNAEAGENFLRADPVAVNEVGEILADIREDDQRAIAVVNRMRSLLERRETRIEPTAPLELVELAAETVDAEILRHGIILGVAVPHGLPMVRCDRILMQQVLINLLLNSVDAVTATDCLERRIDVIASQAGHGAVAFTVEDSGKGFESTQVSRLFQPYFTTKQGGLGLGLAICKNIVEEHGGRIQAENKPAGGARVSFYLQIAQEERLP